MCFSILSKALPNQLFCSADFTGKVGVRFHHEYGKSALELATSVLR